MAKNGRHPAAAVAGGRRSDMARARAHPQGGCSGRSATGIKETADAVAGIDPQEANESTRAARGKCPNPGRTNHALRGRRTAPQRFWTRPARRTSTFVHPGCLVRNGNDRSFPSNRHSSQASRKDIPPLDSGCVVVSEGARHSSCHPPPMSKYRRRDPDGRILNPLTCPSQLPVDSRRSQAACVASANSAATGQRLRCLFLPCSPSRQPKR